MTDSEIVKKILDNHKILRGPLDQYQKDLEAGKVTIHS